MAARERRVEVELHEDRSDLNDTKMTSASFSWFSYWMMLVLFYDKNRLFRLEMNEKMDGYTRSLNTTGNTTRRDRQKNIENNRRET
jgi:hypothetical protein